jgi:putative nucleotidyltransferase with HDIG domain
MPSSPAPPEWRLDWDALTARFDWVQAMAGVPQDPVYHAEGDVWIHTRMVLEALASSAAWRGAAPADREVLFAATLMHDVAKPHCTREEPDGTVSSRGHARRGASLARHILWTGRDLETPAPLRTREAVAALVRAHGLPLRFLEHPEPERLLIEASQTVRLEWVAQVAEADVRGRICRDADDLLERIALFRDLVRDNGCADGPRPFASDHARFLYFRGVLGHPDALAPDDRLFDVVLMAGLPGAGKDHWVQAHCKDRPVLSLDRIRAELRVPPDADQGGVGREARERARALLRRRQPFVWNATNVTRMLRRALIDLFVAYGARVRIVYLDAPYRALLARNRARERRVPEPVIERLARKLDVPDLTEAHEVEWIETA